MVCHRCVVALWIVILAGFLEVPVLAQRGRSSNSHPSTYPTPVCISLGHGSRLSPMEVGPIPGWTSQWHEAPASTFVPSGALLTFKQSHPQCAKVKWTGAVVSASLATESYAIWQMSTPGTYVVEVEIIQHQGTTEMHRCELVVPPEEVRSVRLGSIEIAGNAIDLDESASNQQTMRAFFGPSIAELVNLGEGRYGASLRQPVQLSIAVDPPGFGPLVEWQFANGKTGLGAQVRHVLNELGTQEIHATSAGASASIAIEVYQTRLIAPERGWTPLIVGAPLTFRAETDPPGYENYVRWLSSTKRGTAFPITARGETFAVIFSDVYGSTGLQQPWFGVKANENTVAQDPGSNVHTNTGTITKIPGFAGKELTYRISVTKVAAKTASFLLEITNAEACDITIIVCAMLSLENVAAVEQKKFEIKKDIGGTNKWICSEVGTICLKPSFHFGCKQVTIPSGMTIKAFNENGVFSQDFTNDELGAVYFDILKACPLMNCDQLKGADKFLFPSVPGGSTLEDFANVWACQGAFKSLTPPSDLDALSGTDPGISLAKWPAGNWVTMGYPDHYPARMQGILEGAPTGSVVFFEESGRVRAPYYVPQDPQGLACEGASIAINEAFVIPPDMNATVGLKLIVPEDPCGYVEEGSLVRFHGEVTAEAGAPFYSPGEFMYSVDVLLVRDTTPPVIVDWHLARTSPSTIAISVSAFDEITAAAGAVCRYVAESELIEVPLPYAIPSTQGRVSLFGGDVGNFPLGKSIEYSIVVFDDIGNEVIIHDMLNP